MKSHEKLLAPIAPDAPCGVPLRHEQGFMALLGRARRAPGRQEPKWADFLAPCEQMFSVGIDLGLLAFYARVLMLTSGLNGLRSGLDCIRYAIEEHWPHLHPMGSGDPAAAERVAALRPLLLPRPSGAGALDHFWEDLKKVPLCEPRDAGPVTLFQAFVALDSRLGPQAATGPRSRDELVALIRSAWSDGRFDPDAVAAVVDALDGVAQAWSSRASSELVPIQPAESSVRSFFSRLKAAIPSDPTTMSASAMNAPETPTALSGAGHVFMAGPPRAPTGGPAQTRADARRLLVAAAEYFERHEPGHPAPLLIRRAIRISDKASFFDIVAELLPEAREDAYRLAGEKPPEA